MKTPAIIAQFTCTSLDISAFLTRSMFKSQMVRVFDLSFQANNSVRPKISVA